MQNGFANLEEQKMKFLSGGFFHKLLNSFSVEIKAEKNNKIFVQLLIQGLGEAGSENLFKDMKKAIIQKFFCQCL